MALSLEVLQKYVKNYAVDRGFLGFCLIIYPYRDLANVQCSMLNVQCLAHCEPKQAQIRNCRRCRAARRLERAGGSLAAGACWRR